MWADVLDIRDFYRTTLGRWARHTVQARLRQRWPDASGMRILGLGYALPYLLPYREEAERTIAMMPAQLGVMHWPTEGHNLATLCDEAELPLPDVSMDRVVLAHSIEYTEQLRPMLREVWRVMADGGRLLIVVPNRRSLWSQFDRSPFGHGHPYSPSQINRLLRDNMFAPLETEICLYLPPTHRKIVLAAAPAWEKIGRRWWQRFGGVILIEATKQIYAATPVEARKKRRRVYAPAGISTKRLAETDRAPTTRSGSAEKPPAAPAD